MDNLYIKYMIKKITSLLAYSNRIKPAKYFGTHGPTPTKLQKV